MSDEQTPGTDFAAALAKDNAKPAITPTGPNDAAANWQTAYGVPFEGKGDGLTIAERAVRARGPEGLALHPLPTDAVSAPVELPEAAVELPEPTDVPIAETGPEVE